MESSSDYIEKLSIKSPIRYKVSNKEKDKKKKSLEEKIQTRKWANAMNELMVMNYECKEKDKSLIYPKQEQAAKEVVKELIRGKLNILISAFPQAGKTGVCLKVYELLGQIFQTMKVENNVFQDKNRFTVDNIYWLTAMSCTAWVYQTTLRTPTSLHKNIYHRPNLAKLAKEIKKKTNVLIIIDESHIASNVDQSMHLFFKHLSTMSTDVMIKKNIRIIQASATPNSTLIDLKTWEDKGAIVTLEPDEGYYSPYTLHTNNRVHQYYDLRKMDNCVLFKNQLNQYTKERGKPGISIVRVNKTIEGNLLAVYKQEIKDGSIVVKTFYEEDDDDAEFDELFRNRPNVTILVFIKEKLRCSKTISCKDHILFVVELYTETPNSAVVRQGLLGRMCGYYKEGLPPFRVYTDLNSVFDAEDVKWNSSGLKVENAKIVTYHPTFNNQLVYQNNTEMTRLTNFDSFKEVDDYIRFYYPNARPRTSMNKLKKEGELYCCNYKKFEEPMQVERFLSMYKREINPSKYYKFYPLYNGEQLVWYVAITFPPV